MKNWLLKMFLPMLVEALIEALGVLAANTSTKVDDNMVQAARENKQELIQELYVQLDKM